MSGDATGFFQHPTILIFLTAEAYVPFAAVAAGGYMLDPRTFANSAFSPSFVETEVQACLERFQNAVHRHNNRGKVLYRLLIFIGLIAFSWNSYQNQLPERFLHFDFWDSIYHPWGYWSTRIYKFYLWIFLIPAITHYLFLSVWSINDMLIAAERTNNGLRLDPYHEDGCGGLKIVVNSLLNPLGTIVLVAAALALAAFIVHEKIDVTTAGGFILVLGFITMLYVRPATALRNAIRREKQRQINEIKKKQREYYQLLHTEPLSQEGEPAQAILSLSEVCKHISRVPDWPQLERAGRLLTFLYSTPILGWAVKYGGSKLAGVLVNLH
jgi:hypothetical protein